jgi:AraC-like DNA-binding protein
MDAYYTPKGQKSPNYFFVTTLEALKQDADSLMLPTHAHKSNLHEIVFVTEGFLVQACNLQSIRVNKRELHVLSAGQFTSLDVLSEDVKGYCCQFDNQFLYGLLPNSGLAQELLFLNSFMHRYPLRIDKHVVRHISSCFERMIELYGEHEVNFFLIQSYLTTIVYEIKKELLKYVNPYPAKPFLIERKYNDLLSKYITKQQKIKFYAEQLNISPNHLNKSVKMVTGKSASVILNEVRILEAKIQLKHSDMPIGDIAFNLGFSDSSYFSKCFRKITKLSPLAYRQMG